MKNLRRRDVLLAAAAASLANPLLAADPLKLVVPYPAGGPADIVGRTFAQYFAEELGRAILIDNRAGASGSIGANAVAKSPPDGSVLLLNRSSSCTFAARVANAQRAGAVGVVVAELGVEGA